VVVNALTILQFLGITSLASIEEKEWVFGQSSTDEDLKITIPENFLAVTHEAIFEVTGKQTDDLAELINAYKSDNFFSLKSGEKLKQHTVISDSNISSQLNDAKYKANGSFLLAFKNESVNVFKNEIVLDHKLRGSSFSLEKGIIKYLLIKHKP
jgi:hypothetical protein